MSESVERDYDAYQNDSALIQESLEFVYYDAKSPFTFCDLKETAHGSGGGGGRDKRSALEPLEFYYEEKDTGERCIDNRDPPHQSCY